MFSGEHCSFAARISSLNLGVVHVVSVHDLTVSLVCSECTNNHRGFVIWRHSILQPLHLILMPFFRQLSTDDMWYFMRDNAMAYHKICQCLP